MAGFSYANNEHLVRTNVWDPQLKETFEDELFCQKYVDWVDFPDGDTKNIPSLGQAEVNDFTENEAIRYTGMDTGNFTLTITKYKSSATYITDKMKQDSFYTQRVVPQFVPKQHRAIMKAMEVDILASGNAGQTASALNTINGGDHRFVASGTSAVFQPKDAARAGYALDKANMPHYNRIAIVDPSVGYAIETMTNLVNVSNNPMFQGVITTGMSTGLKFIRNIYGFDFYVSQNLPAIVSETINSVASGASAVCNYFFCAAPEAVPFIGAVRQAPRVESDRNKDLQRDEYVTTARWGVKLFRPEALVTVISATDQVS